MRATAYTQMMSRMGKIFWILLITDTIPPIGYGLYILFDAIRSNQRLSTLHPFVYLFIAVPLFLSAILALAYRNARSASSHWILLALVALPFVVVPYIFGSDYLDQRSEDAGARIYTDSAHTKLLAAIYAQDSNKVREMAAQMDINAVSPDSGQNRTYTPLKFAVEKFAAAANDGKDKDDQRHRRLEMVRLLLSLGAKPNPALEAACRAAHPEALSLLLDAGADPNYKERAATIAHGPNAAEPAFYGCFNYQASLENLKLLAARGANFLLPDRYGNSTVMAAFACSRWEMVLYLHEHGVPLVWQGDRAWVDSMIKSALEQAKQNGREPSEELKKIIDLLNSSGQQQ